MTWGSKAEVLEPESLRQEIREEAEKMLKGYEKEDRDEGTALKV
jgi:predicted DNA-binding transcriptional regulator YafY